MNYLWNKILDAIRLYIILSGKCVRVISFVNGINLSRNVRRSAQINLQILQEEMAGNGRSRFSQHACLPQFQRQMLTSEMLSTHTFCRLASKGLLCRPFNVVLYERGTFDPD